MGLFKNAPYSFANLIKGTLAARANGEPLSGYKYAVAFQQEEDEKLGRRSHSSTDERVAQATNSATLHDASRRAMEKWYAQPGRDIQYEDGDYGIEVKSGFSRNKLQPTTDIIVYDRTSETGLHLHIIIDENGTILHEKERKNK